MVRERKFNNDTDIGIIPGDGLDSPHLDVPKKMDTLFLESGITADGSKGGKKQVGSGARDGDDELVLLKVSW